LRAPDLEFTPAIELGPEGVAAVMVLGVTNRGGADEFQAQIVAWGGDETLNAVPPQTLKWVNTEGPLKKIAPGITEYLEIAHLVRESSEDGRRGIATVHVGWNLSKFLGMHSYHSSEDFQTKIWSLRVIVAALEKQGQRSQGVRLHLFARPADDPTGNMVKRGLPLLPSPVLRMSLFDLNAPLPLASNTVAPSVPESVS
jgi:hypothetical protein